jgi:5'-3' exonuclease
MILLDLNQVMISNLMIQTEGGRAEMQEDLIRHMVLNSIRMYRQKFRKYGELVICADDKNYWRKDIFPYYKAHRKADREKSSLDWHLIFETLNKVRDELKQFFPYRVLQIERAEADDIIGTLTKRFGVEFNASDTEEILILSGDKDFGQLQKYSNVVQFSPVTKKWVKVSNANRFLKEHILKGDRGDGIPNFLSNDSCIVQKERQKPLSSKKVEMWVNQSPEDFCNTDMLRNYKRNQQLVDLDYVPQYITDKVNDAYDKYNVPTKKGLLNYFIKHRLSRLTDCIGEF